MKKLMIFAAVAAMFMFSSCQKEELEPGQNSQPKELVFTASIDQNSTKTIINTDGSDETNRGKIEWVEGDEITITDAESTSVVYVAKSSGASVFFKKKDGETKSLASGSSYSATYKAAPTVMQAYSDYYSAANQAKNLYMTAPATSGTNLTFTAACGLLKLNLTASGDNANDISKIEIVGIPTGGSAAVYTLTCDNKSIESAKDFYIALPAGSYTLMKFTNSKGSVCFKKKASGMTIAANKINSLTLSGIIFSAILPGRFTVASGKQVQFTTANLWCNASESPATYAFESAQNVTYATLRQTEYTEDHVCHFYWSKTASVAYAKTYSDRDDASTDDKFFCGEDNKLTVDGYSGLYALSNDEWTYLLSSTGRGDGNSKFKIRVTVNGATNCLVIAPDGYTGNIESSYDAAAWATAEADGLVCLPAAGYREGSLQGHGGSGLGNDGSSGYYWSATPEWDYNEDCAYYLKFDDSDVNPLCSFYFRYSGSSVRLVKDYALAYPEAPTLACVKIGDVWWAPVNCGYDATNNKYGKFYQWGRKYGQPISGDVSYISTQAVSMAAGNEMGTKNSFYKGYECWYSGNKTSDIWESEYDPCPAGWRVPTEAELRAIYSTKSWTNKGGPSGNQTGYLFGTSPNQVFFPIGGIRRSSDGDIINTYIGCYWSTITTTYCQTGSAVDYAKSLFFYTGDIDMSNTPRSCGIFVRCVKE